VPRGRATDSRKVIRKGREAAKTCDQDDSHDCFLPPRALTFDKGLNSHINRNSLVKK
jgi:hypothetical protein